MENIRTCVYVNVLHVMFKLYILLQSDNETILSKHFKETSYRKLFPRIEHPDQLCAGVFV